MRSQRTMGSFRRLLLAAPAAFASVLVLAVAAAPADAQVPSLSGESLVANTGTPGATLDVTVDCSSPTAKMTWNAEGVAMGPYSGTFTEQGTATFQGTGTLPTLSGPLTSFTATFTIYATTGDVVSGTKTLAPTTFPGSCIADNSPFGRFDANDNYVATIKTATGTYQDTGVGDTLLLGDICPDHCAAAQFAENFTSTSLLPVDTTGKATGGGQVLDATTQHEVTFGFEVHSTSDPNQFQGRCVVIDQTSSTQVKCLDVTDYTQIGNTATWHGSAEVNGVPTTYKITVQDNGEPNHGLDTFSITTNSGYTAAGPVEHGDVQVKGQPLL